MSLRKLSLALSAALVFAGVNTSAQAPTATVVQTGMPGLGQPPSPVVTSEAGVMTFQPAVALPPTLTDAKAASAVVLLDRIKTILDSALGMRDEAKPDKMKKLGEFGTVNVDRASLDEIQSLAAQVAAMFPPRPQP